MKKRSLPIIIAMISVAFFVAFADAAKAIQNSEKPKNLAHEQKGVQHADKRPPVSQKKLKVVTTLAVIASMAREIGGDRVEVHSLLSGAEDPHFVKAKPTFKRLVSEADLFFQIGRSLELWVPLVVSSSGNEKLSGSGLVTVSSGIKTLEVPSHLSRERGDIHPQGNPHVWLSPTAGIKMAENIKDALILHDAAHKAIYEKNFQNFKNKLSIAMFGNDLVKSAGSVDFLWRLHEGKKLSEYLSKHKKTAGGWVKEAEAIDYPFISYHTVWSYMAEDFGLKVFAQIEEKPGVPPSLKYQNELIKRAKQANVKHIAAESYYSGSSKLIEFFAEQIGGKKMFVDVDCRVGESYIAMISRILTSLRDFKALTKPAAKPQ